MFDSHDDVYNFVGQAMFNALPDKWDSAWLVIKIIQVDRSISIGSWFSRGAELSLIHISAPTRPY